MPNGQTNFLYENTELPFKKNVVLSECMVRQIPLESLRYHSPTYFVPDTICFICVISFSTHHSPIISYFHLIDEFKEPKQGKTICPKSNCQGQSWDLNPDTLFPDPMLISSMLNVLCQIYTPTFTGIFHSIELCLSSIFPNQSSPQFCVSELGWRTAKIFAMGWKISIAGWEKNKDHI